MTTHRVIPDILLLCEEGEGQWNLETNTSHPTSELPELTESWCPVLRADLEAISGRFSNSLLVGSALRSLREVCVGNVFCCDWTKWGAGLHPQGQRWEEVSARPAPPSSGKRPSIPAKPSQSAPSGPGDSLPLAPPHPPELWPGRLLSKAGVRDSEENACEATSKP
uniref:Uncharacterized protein n=1 Tax=Mustela putorius furo TaxID=9669 RepID=M3YT97_MUSPF